MDESVSPSLKPSRLARWVAALTPLIPVFGTLPLTGVANFFYYHDNDSPIFSLAAIIFSFILSAALIITVILFLRKKMDQNDRDFWKYHALRFLLTYPFLLIYVLGLVILIINASYALRGKRKSAFSFLRRLFPGGGTGFWGGAKGIFGGGTGFGGSGPFSTGGGSTARKKYLDKMKHKS